VGRVKDRVAVAGRQEFADENVQLAVAGPAAIRHGDEAAVVELAGCVDLQEARADRHSQLGGNRQQPLR
jgi:uncharacterized membrane-anchored protein